MGDSIFSFIKFILTVILAPAVLACILTFIDHLSKYPSVFQTHFIWGLLSFLLIFLFVYQFWAVHEFGQRTIGSIFQFMAPYERIFVNLISFYLVIILLVFYVSSHLLESDMPDAYFMFFSGFFFALHVLLTAQDLQNQEKNPIKPNYFFDMCFVAIFNICFVVVVLDAIVGKFSFLDYLLKAADKAQTFYAACFDKLMNF